MRTIRTIGRVRLAEASPLSAPSALSSAFPVRFPKPKKMKTYRQIMKRNPNGVSIRKFVSRGHWIEAYCYTDCEEAMDYPASFDLSVSWRNDGIPAAIDMIGEEVALRRILHAICKRFGGDWRYCACDYAIVQEDA